jgi:hypothetical protein
MGNDLKTAPAGDCPKCEVPGKPILYGLIEEESPDYLLGGCSIMVGHDPEYVCQKCGAEFGHGGRDYQVEFKIMNEFMFDSFNLVRIQRARLLELAEVLIEARHELLFRGMPQEDLDLMAIQHGWRSFPMARQFEIYVFWHRETQLIEFAARFNSHGVAHRHGFILPNRHTWLRTRSIEAYHRLFESVNQRQLEVWKLRLVGEDSEVNGPEELELLESTRQQHLVPEQQLNLLAVKIADQQLSPSWFDVEQDYANTSAKGVI